MKKTIHQFKAGDIVNFHGGKFLITKNAYSAFEQSGPSPIAIADSICIEGECGSYFSAIRKSEWTFQGNFLKGAFEVN